VFCIAFGLLYQDAPKRGEKRGGGGLGGFKGGEKRGVALA
jgi:hypothetical protein